MPPQDDIERFPDGVDAGTRMVLEAIQGWRHEDREVQAAKHAENRALIEQVQNEMRAVAATVKVAFPEGDADGHRRYHEAIIKRIEAREQFYRKLLAELVSKGLWALLIFLGAAVWYMLKEKYLKG